MHRIPIFRLTFEDAFIEKFQKGAAEILRSDAIAESQYVRQFERDFGAIVHAKHAIAVTSGTAALELALRAIDVQGKIVLMPTNTFFATSIAATNAGADFDLLDIEEESLSIDPDALEEACKKGRGKIGAVIVVHIGGIISTHIERITDICRRNGVPLIEDAAHAHGSERFGKHAGTIGVIGCFSFFPTKVMTTGEGGMVTTNDLTLTEKIRSLKNFGRPPDNQHLCVNEQGNNYKVTEFMGLMGMLECERVHERVKRRNKLLERYVQKLQGSKYHPVLQGDGECAYYKCILRTPYKDTSLLRAYCKEQGIALTGEVYRTPLHEQPIYEEKFRGRTFPVTDAFSKSHICPPLYPELSEDEVDFICDTLLAAKV
jgi:dTDP-4-amino-4,6-dideoxygalactose transaminase